MASLRLPNALLFLSSETRTTTAAGEGAGAGAGSGAGAGGDPGVFMAFHNCSRA